MRAPQLLYDKRRRNIWRSRGSSHAIPRGHKIKQNGVKRAHNAHWFNFRGRKTVRNAYSRGRETRTRRRGTTKKVWGENKKMENEVTKRRRTEKTRVGAACCAVARRFVLTTIGSLLGRAFHDYDNHFYYCIIIIIL